MDGSSCVAFVLTFGHNITINVGGCLPQMWGYMWGYSRKDAGDVKSPARLSGRAKWIPSSGNTFTVLDQIQLSRPIDSCPAIIDIEFTVDALGMCADCAQGDHEFTGDFRPGKLGFEHSKNFKLSLA
jgi:hypothetical protein